MDKAPFSTLHDLPLLLRRLGERARVPAAEHEPRSPEAMLGGLLDVAATVRLADHLAIRAALPTPIRADRVRGPIHARVDRKIGELRAELTEGFRAPFEGRRAAPSAAETHDALTRGGCLEEHDDAKLVAVARRLAPFHRERFDYHLSRGRQRLRWVRIDVTAELRALGPRAAELESFDTVFMRATDPGVAKLTQKLERSVDAAFEGLFLGLASALPRGAALDDLAPWYAPRGPLHRHHADLAALATALVDHDIDALLALVDTAWASRSEEISA